jgi:hypothetical protein
MSEANRYPFDLDKLNKGDLIPVNQIEKIVGVRRNTESYALKLMAVQQRLSRDLRNAGRNITVVTHKKGIKLLTDAEASQYNHLKVHQHRRAMLRGHYRNMEVDVAQLSEEQKSQHDRYIEVDGRFVQAVQQVSAQLKLEPYVRTTPGLPPSSAESPTTQPLADPVH